MAERNYDDWPKVDLQEECKELNLPFSGTVKQLIARLEEYDLDHPDGLEDEEDPSPSPEVQDGPETADPEPPVADAPRTSPDAGETRSGPERGTPAVPDDMELCDDPNGGHAWLRWEVSLGDLDEMPGEHGFSPIELEHKMRDRIRGGTDWFDVSPVKLGDVNHNRRSIQIMMQVIPVYERV